MKKKIFHCLINQQLGTETGIVSETGNIENGLIVFQLSKPLPEQTDYKETYQLEFNEQDRRCLVAFDGEALLGGFPKNSQVLYCQKQAPMTAHPRNMRQEPRNHHWTAKPDYFQLDKETAINIYRYVVLLPAGRACIRRFRPENLSPIYVTIDVEVNEVGELYAIFRTTSY